jgi:hypothetical protein
MAAASKPAGSQPAAAAAASQARVVHKLTDAEERTLEAALRTLALKGHFLVNSVTIASKKGILVDLTPIIKQVNDSDSIQQQPALSRSIQNTERVSPQNTEVNLDLIDPNYTDPRITELPKVDNTWNITLDLGQEELGMIQANQAENLFLQFAESYSKVAATGFKEQLFNSTLLELAQKTAANGPKWQPSQSDILQAKGLGVMHTSFRIALLQQQVKATADDGSECVVC